MFEEYDMQNPFLSMGFADEIDIEFEEAEKELALSQAQGSWLDGYLDAMDELEDAEDV